MIIVGLIGSGLFVAGFRRLVGEPTFVLVIATLGLSVVIETIVVLIWGPNPRPMPNLIDRNGGFEVLGMRFSPLDVYCIVVCLTIILALDLMLKRTRLGSRMRAVADGPLLAGLNKIPVNGMSGAGLGDRRLLRRGRRHLVLVAHLARSDRAPGLRARRLRRGPARVAWTRSAGHCSAA